MWREKMERMPQMFSVTKAEPILEERVHQQYVQMKEIPCRRWVFARDRPCNADANLRFTKSRVAANMSDCTMPKTNGTALMTGRFAAMRNIEAEEVQGKEN